MASTTTVKLRLDQYGKYARASALADFLEIITIRKGSGFRTDLELSLDRGGWYRARRGLFTMDPDVDLDSIEDLELSDGTEDPDDPDWPDWAMSILRQRLDVLGAGYPFTLRNDGLEANPGWDSSEYVRLLGLTAAHAYEARLKVDPRGIFERLLVTAIGSLGVQSAGMGTATGRGQKFTTQLDHTATAVGMTASPAPYPAKTFAKDAGVDVVGVMNWNDRRPGQIVLLAQATLAASARWEAKISEPKPRHWGNYLLEPLDPLAILAVPHHIEDEHFRHLLLPHATIVDRLRLVGRLGPTIPGESDVLKWLETCDLDY